MRVSILRMDYSEYELIWSFHHILMDGWCLGILNKEFFEIYNSFKENRPYRLPVLKPFCSYIRWLQEQDTEKSKKYWEDYLESFDEQTGVPKPAPADETEKESENCFRYKNEEVLIFGR